MAWWAVRTETLHRINSINNIGEKPAKAKRFDIFLSLNGGCSEGLDAFGFFLKQLIILKIYNFRRANNGQ